MGRVLKHVYVWGFVAAILVSIGMGYVELWNAPPGTESLAGKPTRYCIEDGKRTARIRCLIAARRGHQPSFYYVEAGGPIPKIGVRASGGSLQPLPTTANYADLWEQRGSGDAAPQGGGGPPESAEPTRRLGPNEGGGEEEEGVASVRRPAVRAPRPAPAHP